MNFVEIAGTRLEVQSIAGSASLAPVVFLHEGLGSVSLWTQRGRNWPEAVCQASGRAGLVHSRRGYGRSNPVPDVRGAGRLPPDYMHREAWEMLPALLANQGINQPVLLGHSDGASIALLHASRHWQRRRPCSCACRRVGSHRSATSPTRPWKRLPAFCSRCVRNISAWGSRQRKLAPARTIFTGVASP